MPDHHRSSASSSTSGTSQASGSITGAPEDVLPPTSPTLPQSEGQPDLEPEEEVPAALEVPEVPEMPEVPEAPKVPKATKVAAEQNGGEDPLTVGEINTATHVVVEHLHSGTVRTHVYSSKDGHPSMFKHADPRTLDGVMSAMCDDKLQELNFLVQDSIDSTKKESLEKFDAVRSILEMNDARVASQVETSSNMIETQIRTEIVPMLNEIERLLLHQGQNQGQVQARDKGKGKAKAESKPGSPSKAGSKLGSPYCASSASLESSEENTHTSMESMDLALLAEITRGRAIGKADEGDPENPTDDIRDSSDSAIADSSPMCLDTNPAILEMLSTIESQVGALCKVVIEGQTPDIGGFSDDPRSTAAASGDTNGGLVDPETLARFVEMKKEMLTFPDALTDTNSRMERLIEALAAQDHAAAASGSGSNGVSESSEESRNGPKARENRERWESNMSEMLASYHERLQNLDTRLQDVDTGVQRMDVGFGDWRRSHQLSLSTFLRYMYMVHKRTESVDTRIHKALEEIKDQTKIDPEQLPLLLNSMRTEIMNVLTSLPGTIASQLNLTSEALEHAEQQNSVTEPTDPSTEAEDKVQAGGPATIEVGVVNSQPGSRALGVPGPRITPESPVLAPATALEPAETLSSSNEATGATENTETPCTAHVEELNPDDLIKSFAETLDFVKDGVASMIHNYTSLAASMVQLTASLPSDSVVGDAAASAPATGATTPLVTTATTPLVTAAATPPATSTITTEGADTVDAATTGAAAAAATAIASPSPTVASEAPEPPPRERSETRQTRTSNAHGARTRSRAPTSSRDSQEDVASASAIGEDVSAVDDAEAEAEAGEDITDGSAITKEFVNEIEDMNRRLDNFMRMITDATGRLSVGHNSLRDEFLREMQRVIAAIHAVPEMNEGRIRNLEAENQARLNENDMLRRQAAMTDQERSITFERISMIPNLMESLEGLNTHQSNQVDAVMREVLEIRADTEALKSTVVACHQDVKNVLEGSKQDSRVIGAVRDHVETLSGQQDAADDVSLTAQVAEVLKTATGIGAMVGDVKAISEQSRMQQDALERKLDELFKQQQESFELCGKKHDEGWQTWFDKHTAEVGNIEKWHEKHDADMRDLDQWRHFHRGELEDWHQRHGEQLSGIQKCRCRCCIPEHESKAEVEEESRAPSAMRSTNTYNGTNPPKQRVRELFNEFLEGAMTEPENAAAGSLSDIADSKPASPAEDLSSEHNVTDTHRELGDSSGPVAQREMVESASNRHVQPSGESSSYHGAPVIPPGRSAALPQELYSLLRPYFISEPTATQDHEAVESEELLGLMQRVMDRDQEIDALRADATQMGEKIDKLEDNLAEKDQRLKDAWADISSLCRAGIVVNADTPAPAPAETAAEPSAPVEYPLPKTNGNNNANESEADSTTTSSVVTIRKLMEESAVYLHQALEELKAQKGELHHEIRRLREERDELRKDTSGGKTKAPRKAASSEDKGKSKVSADEDNSTLKVPGEEGKGKSPSEESDDIEEVVLAEADVVDDEEYAEEVVSPRQRGDRGRSRGVGAGSSKSFSTYRKRQSYQARSRSRGPGGPGRGNGGDMFMKKVPQLGADISICRNGVHAETLLSSKALLTPELFESGRSDGVNEPWSLSCNFKVRMVDHP